MLGPRLVSWGSPKVGASPGLEKDTRTKKTTHILLGEGKGPPKGHQLLAPPPSPAKGDDEAWRGACPRRDLRRIVLAQTTSSVSWVELTSQT